MSEWTALALMRASTYGVHVVRPVDTDTLVQYDFVPDPHAWGPARPMQITATIGVGGDTSTSYWGKATLMLSDDYQRTNTVAGSVEFVPVTQQQIENITSAFATIYPQSGSLSSGVIAVQQIDTEANLLDLQVPTNARHQVLLTLSENGTELWRREINSLIAVANHLRLWAFQPDESHAGPIIGFGIYDNANQAIHCYQSSALNFLRADALGFLPKAFSSLSITYPAGRSQGTGNFSHSPAAFNSPIRAYSVIESGSTVTRWDMPLGDVLLASCQYQEPNEIGTSQNPALRGNASRAIRNISKPYSGAINETIPFGFFQAVRGQAIRSSANLASCLSHLPAEYDERLTVRKLFAVPVSKSQTHCPALKSPDKPAQDLKVEFRFAPLAAAGTAAGDFQTFRAAFSGNTQVVQSSGSASVSPQSALASYVVVRTATTGQHTVTIQDGTFVGQWMEISFVWFPHLLSQVSVSIQDNHGNTFAFAPVTLYRDIKCVRVVWNGTNWIADSAVAGTGYGGANTLALLNHEFLLGVTSPLAEQYAPGSYHGVDTTPRELFRVRTATEIPPEEVRWTSLTNRSTLPPIRFADSPALVSDFEGLTLRELVAQKINALNYEPVQAVVEFFLAGNVTWETPILMYAYYDKVFLVEKVQCFATVQGVFESEDTAQKIQPAGGSSAVKSTSGNLDAWQSGSGKSLYADSGRVFVSGLLAVDIVVQAENFGIHWGGVLIGQEKIYWPNGPDQISSISAAPGTFINTFDTGTITAARWYINPPCVAREHRFRFTGDLTYLPAIDAAGNYWLDLPIPASPQWSGPSIAPMEKRRVCYQFFATLTPSQANELANNGFVDVPIDTTHSSVSLQPRSGTSLDGTCSLLIVG
jgi:hypothetical protein